MKLSFKIHQKIDTVFEYLTDMQKFVSVHPLIFQIDHITDESYTVHERLRVGFIPFSFTYPVTIEKDRLNNIVIIRAIVFKLTRIDIKFILKEENDYTVIDEEITFKSPLPITFIMEKIFRKQHSLLFKNMSKWSN